MKKILSFFGMGVLLSQLMAQTPNSFVSEPSMAPIQNAMKKMKPQNNKAGTLIWGAGATTGALDGEFANAFVQATSFSAGSNPTSWTALTVSDGNGTPGAAYWVRNTTGYSAGAYWNGTTPHSAASQANGSALFDSDFMDNGGTAGNFGLGTSPSRHKGELISPRIDLTGYTDSAIAVSFFSYYRDFITTSYTVGISTDDGATFTDVDVFQFTSNLTQENPEIVFPSVTAGVANLSQCRIRFSYDGDYYFYFVDDVSISVSTPYDLTIAEANPSGNTLADDYTDLQIMNNHHYSVNQLVGHHFRFGANVKNVGSDIVLPANNAKLRLAIQRGSGSSWTTVYQDSISVDTLNPTTTGRPFSAAITNQAWATVGDYRVVYHTSLADDNNAGNDTLFQFFSLNDDVYLSKVDLGAGAPAFNRPIFPGGTSFNLFEYGSLFSIPNGAGKRLDSISYIYYIPTGYTGSASRTIDLFVYEWLDGSNGGVADGLMDADKSELIAVGGTTQPVTNLTTALGTYRSINSNVFDLNTSTVGLPLQDNKIYFVSLALRAASNGATPFTSTNMVWFGASENKSYSMNTIGASATNIIPHPSSLFLLDGSGNPSGNWLGFGMDIVPSFGLNISNVCSSFTAVIDSSQQATCNGAADGVLRTSVSGGLAPYTYGWSDNSSSADLTGAAGTYSVTVTDANSCSAILTDSILEPVILTVSVSATDATCFGGNDGSVSSTVSGGTAPFTYSWSNSASTANLTNVMANTYTVGIVDANGCSATGNATVNEPSQIIVTVNVDSNVICNGNSDGGVTATFLNGVAPFTYNWSVNNTTPIAAQSFESASTDTWSYSVNPATYNTEGDSVVSGSEDVWAAIRAFTSGVDTASDGIHFWGGQDLENANGGGAFYHTIDFSPINLSSFTGTTVLTFDYYTIGFDSSDSLDYQLKFDNGSNWDTTGVSLAPSTNAWTQVKVVIPSGSSFVRLRLQAKQNGASDYLGFDNISLVEDLSATFNPLSLTKLSAGTYDVTITDANGCTGNGGATVTEPTALSLTMSEVDISCFGLTNGSATASAAGGTAPYTYAWSNSATTTTINNLAIGTYIVTVTDANGCNLVDSSTIAEPTAITTSITTIDESCSPGSDGSSCVTTTGGTPPYSYSWNDPTNSITSCVNNLTAGSYSVTITDGNGCSIIQSVVINAPTPFTSSATITDVSCNGGNDGTIALSLTGGTSPFSYSWSAGLGPVQNQTGLIAGNYNVTITDANGCTEVNMYTIVEPVAAASAVSQTACNTFTWMQNNQTYLQSGAFNDTVQNGRGCDSIITLNLTIDSAVFTATQISNSTVQADQIGATYQWLDCNNNNAPIAGETSRSFTATINGSVAVEVTNGSCVDTSACIVIILTGIDENDKNSEVFKLFPNPNNGKFSLLYSNYNSLNERAQFFDVRGKLVYEMKVANTLSEVDLFFLEDGIYFVRIGSEMKKFILSK